MNAIESLNFEGWNVRHVIIDGDVWFIARDVAQVLGYANPADAITRHSKGVAKHYPLQTAGGMQDTRIIGESDVMRLIVSSRLPAATQFELWLFETVLPQIRRTGSYGVQTAVPDIATPQGVLEMAQLFAKTAGELVDAKQEIAVLAPRAAVADAFEQDDGLKIRAFVQKYFPDEKESAILDFFYHVKGFLIHDPQGRWSEVRRKYIPGPQHQHPRAHGREFFHLAEETDFNGKVRKKVRIRRDREHHLVGYLARHGFRTQADVLPELAALEGVGA